ncbi:MAG TPA: PDZ domain-containing protein [Vicinamibacterales bacterium]
MLTDFSNQMAEIVASAAPSVVQVQGRRRPASGVVHSDGIVVTTMRALGREDGIHVRVHGGDLLNAELAGWDPATSLAALRVPGLKGPGLNPAHAPARVGHMALAVARSWSNAVTASAGIVAVIGGPLPTGRRRAIDQVIRTTAPMHDGFAGGAFLDTAGGLLGVATAAEIRGLAVIIPTAIAWNAIANVLEHGSVKRGYLGIAGQPVTLPESQRAAAAAGDRDEALLVVGVTPDSPAARAGVLVGDIIVTFDGQPIESPEDLLDLLAGNRVGRPVSLRMLRGRTATELSVAVGERPRPRA